jgi:hypothetical protein
MKMARPVTKKDFSFDGMLSFIEHTSWKPSFQRGESAVLNLLFWRPYIGYIPLHT